MTNISIDFETYKKEEDGFYHPILNASEHAILGAIRLEGQKKTHFFDMRKGNQKILEFLYEKIDAENKRKRTPTIWAHNWNFDYSILAKGQIQNKEMFEAICYKPFIVMMKTPNGGQARLIDLMSFYKMKLEEVGRKLGIPKKEMPRKISDIKELYEYIETDCTIVLEAVNNLKTCLKEIGYEPKKFTSAPKLAYNFFQTICEKQIYTKPNGKKVSHYAYLWHKGRIHQTKEPEMAQMACRGGHLEQFTTSKEIFKDVYKVDINSSYPFVCSNYPFPDLLSEKIIEEPTTEILDKIGIVEATLKAPNTFLPYLPIRYNKKVIYPSNTTIRGFWTIYEVNKAIKEYGYELIELHKAITYRELPFNPFKIYFDKLYQIKKTNKSGMEHVAKLLANSLTGKFAYQVGETDRIIATRSEMEEKQSMGYEIIHEIEGTNQIIMEKIIEEKKYAKTSNPIIYAHITAYGRDLVYDHLKKIPEEDLLYVVTDAIIFRNKENLKHFKMSDEMGDWKIEKQAEEAEFFNEHYYRLDDEIKASGTKKGDVTLENLRKQENYTTKAMITAKQAWRTGQFQQVGTFIDKPMHLKMQPKRTQLHPPYIEETPKSRMISMINQLIKETTTTF